MREAGVWAGFAVGMVVVGASAITIPSLPELAYGFVIAGGCAVVVLLCAIVLRVREPRFAYGLAWGAAAGFVLASGVVIAVIGHVLSGSA